MLLLWAFAFGQGLRLLPYPEVHGFSLALVGVILAAVWQMSGYTMALYLAGLRGIPVEVLEVSRGTPSLEALFLHLFGEARPSPSA